MSDLWSRENTLDEGIPDVIICLVASLLSPA